jgi:hypothetical protein
MTFCAVITTIHPPTASVAALASRVLQCSGRLIAIGDQKGPDRFDIDGADFHSLAAQKLLPLKLAAILPTRHYARKNLGYLLAMQAGAPCIYETDDDNAPSPHWKPLPLETQAQEARAARWLNVYRLFTDKLIWPRGFPLNKITDPATWQGARKGALRPVQSPIQQGLADLSPDVDAVWRLVLDHEFAFERAASVSLPRGTWCPWNSQNTWWWPEAYVLMYLPSTCSFRMTDIWRSFIAQRCLWEMGYEIIFHPADVIQQRNVHNLMRDFNDEISGYQRNDELVDVLESLTLSGGVAAAGDNMLRCYEALTAKGFFAESELPLVRAWISDVASLRRGSYS